MRGLLLIAAVILILIVVGWITISFTGDRASITLEKEKIKQDTSELTEFGNEADERMRRTVEPEPAPAPQP